MKGLEMEMASNCATGNWNEKAEKIFTEMEMAEIGGNFKTLVLTQHQSNAVYRFWGSLPLRQR